MKSKKSTPRYNPISRRSSTRSTVAASDGDDDKEPSPDGLRDSTEAKLASSQKSKKSTPRYNPISRSSTRSSVAASDDDDEKEPSPDGLRDSPGIVTGPETALEENKGLVGNRVEAENVATVSAVAGTNTRADCDVAVVADIANLSSGDTIDDNGKANELNLRNGVAVDDQKSDNPIDGAPFLTHEGVIEGSDVNTDNVEGATRKENLGVHVVSNLNFSSDGVEEEEDNNVHFCAKDDNISLDGGVPKDVALDSVLEDKSNGEGNNVGVSEEAKNLSGKSVGGVDLSCVQMEHDSSVVEDCINEDEEKQLGEGQNNEYICDDHSQLGYDQDSEHNVVEEESPAAGFEDKETLGCFDDISGPVESDDGKEEGGNSEDGREEEDGNVESENDGDHSEDSIDYEDENEEREDDKDKNEENEEDKDPCKSINNPLSRKTKGVEIYVGGLDKEAVDDDLIEVFGKFGDIQETRIIKHRSGRSKGYAFIRYVTVDQARNAVSELKDGIEVRGKRVKVSASQENATLIMDNICKSWTKDHVLNKLKDYGIQHIEEVYLPNDPASKEKIKGFALLAFSSRKDAMAAHKLLRRPDAIFGCDRSVEVAFMSSQVQSIGDLSQVKSSISRRRGRRQKVTRGGFKVKEISEKTQVRAKSKEAEKECEGAEQACSSRTKGEEKRQSMKLKITGSKSSRPKSRATENRVVMPSKSTKIHHERKHLPSNSDDRGKRKLEDDYNTRPSKKQEGNRQSTTRNTIRSRMRNPQVREQRHAGYHEPAHGAISGSKRLHSDMEPHAGYVKPAALKHIQHHSEYREPDIGNHHQRHLVYLEPALGSQSLLHANYFVPALENKHLHRVSHLEPSLGREHLSHAGYLGPATGIQSHSAYHHGLRRDAVYDHINNPTYGRVSARPSYVPHSIYPSHGGYEVDNSRRVGGYHHIGQTFPLPRQ